MSGITLTPDETSALWLTSLGLPQHVASRVYGTSERTYRRLLLSAGRKLGARNLINAVALAAEQGLITIRGIPMDNTSFPPGTVVVVPGRRIGWIVKEARVGQAHGYSVWCERQDSTEGTAPHFVADDALQVAKVGVNVCRHPRGEHWCGLLHVDSDVLREIRAASALPGPTAVAR